MKRKYFLFAKNKAQAGAYFGTGSITKAPIFLDLGKQPLTSNVGCMGSPGGGMSFYASRACLDDICKRTGGDGVLIVDPKSDI